LSKQRKKAARAIRQALQRSRGAVRRGVRLAGAAARNFLADEGFDRCAAISYYALLSSLPFFGIAALVGGWLLGSRDWVLHELVFGIEMLVPAAPGDATARARIEMGRQGALLLIMSPFLLWTSSYAASAVEGAINHILRSREHRKFLIAKLKSIGLLAVGAANLLLIPAIQQLGVVARHISGGSLLQLRLVTGYRLLTEAAILLAAFLTFAFTFISVPATRLPRREALLVAALAAGVWQVARLLLATALGAATGPSVVSSSFSFVIATLLWVYITATIVLFATEILALLTGRR